MMGRMGDQSSDADRNPSVSAADEAVDGGIPIRPGHISSPSCWCHPVEVEPGLWLHNEYVSDLRGAIEGDDGAR